MSIAALIIAANEVGPAEVGQNYYYQSLSFENLTHELLMNMELFSFYYSFTRIHLLLAA
jgi:hypothetical protein